MINRLKYFTIFTLFVIAFFYACDKKMATNQKEKNILNSKLALTPPMGWNSWNMFNEDINEQLINWLKESYSL